MLKHYSFLLTESWFSKSDDEVAEDNISKRTSREVYEDLKTFIEYFRQIYFLDVLFTDLYLEILYCSVIREHSKTKDFDNPKYSDLDFVGQKMFGIMEGILQAKESGLFGTIFQQMVKYWNRFEPDEFKRYCLNTNLDSMYKDLTEYLKQNKLIKTYNEIIDYINKMQFIQYLEEQLKEVRSIANDQGYRVDLKTVPKMVINSTIHKFNTKLNKKLPKSLSNTIPKNKIKLLRK